MRNITSVRRRSFVPALVLALAAVLALASALGAQNAAPKAAEEIQGTWTLVSVNGRALLPEGYTGTMTFTGDKYVATMNGRIVEQGNFRLDTTKLPIQIDLNIVQGSPRNKGKTQIGIVEVTVNDARLHLAQAGATTRPTDFASAATFDLLVLKRK